MKKSNIITLVFVVFGLQFSLSQVKEGTIGSEVVNIVKPYTPTISDAFKVKETPVLQDEEKEKKEVRRSPRAFNTVLALYMVHA